MKKLKHNFVVPIIFLLLGGFASLILSFHEEVSWVDGATLSITLSVAATLIEQSIIIKGSEAQRKEKCRILDSKVEFLITLLSYDQQLNKIKHPYFVKWTQRAVAEFLKTNHDLLNGTKSTSPHNDDTFGIEGILYTKDGGCIKAVSSIKDYWEDDFSKLYLETQRELIKSKNITVQRIFLLNSDELTSKKALLDTQYRHGIQVYYTLLGSPYIDPEWCNEDFLIQDNELLVELKCDSHKYDSANTACEKITVSPLEVQEKLVRFERMLERATRYVPSA